VTAFHLSMLSGTILTSPWRNKVGDLGVKHNRTARRRRFPFPVSISAAEIATALTASFLVGRRSSQPPFVTGQVRAALKTYA
jgi:hypothetical protein